jgi:hypothetical protein
LLGHRDERGRNWLHVCCGVEITGNRDAASSIELARSLIGLGLDPNAHAFTEGEWRATPLWYAIGRGRNLPLADWLLDQGVDPNYCLYAAAFGHDLPAIRLLISHGADVDDLSAGNSPFLDAVSVSHFDAAEELLKHGADVNRLHKSGLTALHLMLKKGTEPQHLAMLARYGARGDIPDPTGQTAADILRRKRDADYRHIADQLA